MLVNHEIRLRRSDDTPVWVVVNENALESEAGLAVKEGSLVATAGTVDLVNNDRVRVEGSR